MAVKLNTLFGGLGFGVWGLGFHWALKSVNVTYIGCC